MGFLDAIFKRNSELSFMFDTEFFVSASTRIHMKHLAVETCANFLAQDDKSIGVPGENERHVC